LRIHLCQGHTNEEVFVEGMIDWKESNNEICLDTVIGETATNGYLKGHTIVLLD
jgi:hypothetical protein